tara:strand:- start:97 stop:600 length:504 start_codon:yes stop_codon:yes gene_type:complete
MRLLREYIRGLLVEQDEEEKTSVQKILEIFFQNPTQAVELGEQLNLDLDVVGPMRQILNIAHELIGLAREASEIRGSSATTQGMLHDKKRANQAYQAGKAFDKALWGFIFKHKLNQTLDRQTTGAVSLIDLFTKDLVYIAAYGHPSRDHGADINEFISDAVDWAGEP